MEMASNILFSIIIPAYNNLALFKQAFLSAIKQQNVDFEIIVVDDSDIDDICLLVNSYDFPHLRYTHNVSSLGAVPNWNKGISMARGRYVILLHHDEQFADVFHLKRISDEIYDQLDLIINPVTVTQHGVITKRLGQWRLIGTLIQKFPAILFFVNLIGPTACVVVKRDILQEFDSSLHWLVDTEWYYRLLTKAQKVLFLHAPMIISTHGHQDQITQQINIKEAFESDASIIRRKYCHKRLVSMMLTFNRFMRQEKIHVLLQKIR
jgi:glycosyltransferase involved in cell wall biosynthesis